MIQYVSPLSFLPEDSTSSAPSSRSLKLARQRLMAEFELAGTTTIVAGGKEMTRNDVLKMFDELETSGDLAYHTLVASDPVLLHFLMVHDVPVGKNFSLKDGQVRPEFIEWISPYFAFAFKRAATRMFRDELPAEFERLVLCPHWMTDADKWDAWAGVEGIMEAKLQSFQQLNNGKNASMDQKQKYGSYNAVWLVCNMPEGRFGRIINDYAFELMRLAITEFNTQKHESAFALIGYAKSLSVSDEVMDSLVKKEEEMQGLIKKNRRSQLWNVAKIVAFVIYVLAKMASCNI